MRAELATNEPASDRHVGFSGTRRGMTVWQAAAVGELIRDYAWLDHGDCVGSDAQAHAMAQASGLRTAIHPPTDGSQRAYCQGADIEHAPRAYLTRNRAIVSVADHFVAAPREVAEVWRGSGTWAAIRYARTLRKPLSIVFEDGSVQHER